MLLNKQIQILVFKVTSDGVFDSIGEVNQYTNLIWPDKFNGYGQFELWAPITDENADYFVKGNYLWCGGDNAAVVEIVKSTVDEQGDKAYNVKGRTLEMLLTTRIIWGTYNAQNKYASTCMYEIVDQNCINPTDLKRKIPFLELAQDLQIGERISIQRTGTEVYDACSLICSNQDIGFNILFRPVERKLIFEVVAGIDRTVEQTVNDPVEFSTDLEDILASSYYTNNQDEKHVALVMGEGSGNVRKCEVSGDDSKSLFERRELYVDARDIQSISISESGVETQLTPEQYSAVLIQRGDEKLSKYEIIELFEAKIRVFGDVQYEFGVDYQKGDKVTVRDTQLNVTVSARITEVEEEFDDDYGLVLTFGYQYPTILQKAKQMQL